MFWYLLNIFITIVLWFTATGARETMANNTDQLVDITEQTRRKRVCIVATMNWILLSGLRGLSVGADTLSYKINRFDRIVDVKWEDIIKKIYLKYSIGEYAKDPGYDVVEKAFQVFSKNYQLFLIFIATLFFVSLGILIYKYSSNPCVSYIIFDCLFYSFFAVTGHRQTIATVLVVLVGVNYIRRRKLLPFIVLCLIASTIHMSALCFLPFYWISKIRINKATLTVYWIAIFSAFVFRYRFLNLLQGLIGYEQYQDFEGAGAGAFLILLILLSVFVTVFHRKILREDNFFMQISINALLTACIFSSLLLINQSCMRVVQYFALFVMFVLPECKYVFKEGKSRGVFICVCCSLMILLMILNNPHYVFFWQE